MVQLASIPLPTVLIFITCGHFVLRTNATFFVEVHDRNSNPRVSLYECNASSPQGSPRTESPLPPSYTTNQDIPCTEVVNKRRKRDINSTANFYLVVNPRLAGGRRIILGSRSAEMPRSIFLGVTTVGGEPADYPALSRDLDGTSQRRLSDKCMVTLDGIFLRQNMNFQALVVYMGIADFHQFARPVEAMTARFRSFSEIVRRVQERFVDNIVNARQNEVSRNNQELARTAVKPAVGLLIQKLIDPCFIMSYLESIGEFVFVDQIPLTPREVGHSMCKSHCMLLRAATALHPNAPGCARAVRDGQCVNQVCVCERWRKGFACTGGPKYFAMIKCSNEIRVGLAGSVAMGV